MFVLPIAALACGFAGVLGVVLLWFVVVAIRSPLLYRLGTRTILRQRLRATLIVCGLTVSSTVAGSALGAGDTITNTLRSLVAGSLGSVDEVVVLSMPRGRLGEQARALVEPGFGGLAAARLQFFPQIDVERVRNAAASNPAIAAIAPTILEQVTVVGDQELRSALPLLAIPRDDAAAFGTMLDADGTPVAFDAIADDQIVLNQAAADTFGNAIGPTLRLLRGDDAITFRVAAIIQNGGLGGTGPLLLMPLDVYQHATDRAGRINQIIVANVGGAQSVTRSDEATRALRVALSDLDIAGQLHALMGRADIQRGLRDLEADLDGQARATVAALRVEARHTPMSDEFVRLIAAPQVRQRLFALAWRAGTDGREASGLLRRLSDLHVLDVKQEALARAASFGSAVTTIFLALGMFATAAAVMLVLLTFHLLASDRGVELATLRALGMRRGQIMALFLVEGLAYNLLGATVGTLASLGAVMAMGRSINAALLPWGIALRQHIEPASLVLAFAASAVVTFVVMVFASYRVSHSAIIGGTRGESQPERPARSALLAGVALLVVAASAWWRWHAPAVGYLDRHPLVLPVAVSLATWGVAACIAGVARIIAPRHARAIASVAAATACIGLGVAWLRVLGRHDASWGLLRADVVVTTVGAVVLLVVAVVLVAQMLGPVLGAVDRALLWVPRVRAAARPALRYLQVRRGRAGMTIAMFAMIVCVMVAALVLIDALLRAYGSEEPPVGGYDLRADVAQGATFDLAAAWGKATAIAPGAFSAYGGLVAADVQAVEFGLARAAWEEVALIAADDDLLRGLRTSVEVAPETVDSSGAPWARLALDEGTAIIVGAVLRGERESILGQTVWVRPTSGGTPIRLRVVGTGDARSSLAPGIYVARRTAEGMGVPLPVPTSYFFAVRAPARPSDAALGLRLAFGEQGVSVAELSNAADIGRFVRHLLTAIVQGFLGIGLVAGVVALGLLGVQSVLERRQQIGTLRALGFRRRDVRATLAWEGVTIGMLGLGLGTVLGLILARSVIAIIATASPEVRFVVPWLAIAQSMLLAVAGATLAVAVAAWRAGRIAPAEALRLD